MRINEESEALMDDNKDDKIDENLFKLKWMLMIW